MENIITQDQAKSIVESFISQTENQTKVRQSLFEKFQDFVLDGNQWNTDEEPEGNDPKMSFNQSEDFVNIYQSKLFPRNMESGVLEIGVKIKADDKAKKIKFENEIIDSYKKNKLAKIVLEQTQNYFIGGSGILYYPKDQITKKAKIISLDPKYCYLGWAGSELEQFALSLSEVEKDKKTNWFIQILNKVLFDNKEASRKFKKIKRFTYWDKEYQIIKIENDFKITKNEDGLIPVSWIPNQPKAHQHEGRPETAKLYDLEKEYNKRASDFALRVKANTKATLAVMTEQDSTSLVRDDLTGILPLNKDEDAKFLELKEDKELLDFLGIIEKKMCSKMATNDAVNGEIKSNVSSLSMVYYFSPLMDRIGLKRIYWDEAFRELNKAILTYAFGVGEYDTDPIYQPVLLTDVKTKIENTILMLENHLISYEDAIDTLRGMENSNEKLDEIIKEIEEKGELLGIKEKKEPEKEAEYFEI